MPEPSAGDGFGRRPSLKVPVLRCAARPVRPVPGAPLPRRAPPPVREDDDMPYDVDRIRSHFPALAEGAAHFDGPGGTQVPDVVGEAVASTLTAAISNRG